MIFLENRYTLFRIMLEFKLLLLASDCLGWPLARACIGVGALTTDRQTAAMTQATVTTKVHQALDVNTRLATQIALNDIIAVNHLADLQDFLVCQLIDAALLRDLHLLYDISGDPRADTMNILQCNQHTLIGGNIYAGNTGHGLLSCCQSVAERPLSSCCLGQVLTNANTTPAPRPGARHRLKLSDLDTGLIRGFKGVSSTTTMP